MQGALNKKDRGSGGSQNRKKPHENGTFKPPHINITSGAGEQWRDDWHERVLSLWHIRSANWEETQMKTEHSQFLFKG